MLCIFKLDLTLYMFNSANDGTIISAQPKNAYCMDVLLYYSIKMRRSALVSKMTKFPSIYLFHFTSSIILSPKEKNHSPPSFAFLGGFPQYIFIIEHAPDPSNDYSRYLLTIKVHTYVYVSDFRTSLLVNN